MNRIVRPLLAAIAVLGLTACCSAAVAATPSRQAAERALEQAEALFAPATAATQGSGREASNVLRRLAIALPRLGRGDRSRARSILARPTEQNDTYGDYFGREADNSPVCDPHFCVHWSRKVGQAPAPIDTQPDGVPDYVESVLEAAGHAYQVENATLGWRKARSDGAKGSPPGAGTSGQVDVYLADLGRSLFGYATPDPAERGRRRAGYLVLDNDYAGFGGVPLDLMRVTMAHEYNHILQFNYDALQDGWMFESTATWMEELVFPGIDDYLNFVSDFAKAPFKPMAEPERKASRLYGSAMWNHWLTAALGAGTIREAWAVSAQVRPRDFAVAAYQRAIAGRGGGTFARQFAAFAAASAEWNSPTTFPDAGVYPDVKRSGSLLGRRELAIDHTAYHLFRVNGGGPKTLKARVEPGTRAAIALVGRKGPFASGTVDVVSRYLARGGRARVGLADAGAYDRVTAVVINADGRVRGKGRDYSRDGRRFVFKLIP